MVDKFGNPLEKGCWVVYSTKDDSPQVGTVKHIKDGMLSISTPWGRTITRAYRDVIAYTGVKP